MTSLFPSSLRRLTLAAVGLVLVAGGLSACVHHRHEASTLPSAQALAEHRAKVVERVARRLDLNDDQKGKLTALGNKLHEQRVALMGNNADPRSEVLALIAGTQFDQARAQALVQEKTFAVQSKAPEVLAATADFYNSLNAAQQQKVRDFLQRGPRKGHGMFSD